MNSVGLVLPWAVIGSLGTLTLALVTLIFHTGKHAARLEALEEWRGSIRVDMHEISDQLGALTETITRLETLIEERTDRRSFGRQQPGRPEHT